MSQNEPMDPGTKRRCLQHYRDMLGRAGFTVLGEEELPNGHAPFPHMPPWAYFLVPGGLVLRFGVIVSCYHLDYSRTPYRGDLFPERTSKTGFDSCVELDEKEMGAALERLYGYLYLKKK